MSEIRDIKNSKTEAYWVCQTCMSDKFRFTLIENEVVLSVLLSPANAKYVNMKQADLDLFPNTELMIMMKKGHMIT